MRVFASLKLFSDPFSSFPFAIRRTNKISQLPLSVFLLPLHCHFPPYFRLIATTFSLSRICRLLVLSPEEMGSRTASHQLKNGLYVSGRAEQVKERQPTMTSRAVPYTGGDVKKSGELGKMYGVDSSSGHHQGLYVQKPLSRAPSSSQQHNNAASRSRPNSGQQGHKSNTSGPIPKKSLSFSGPTPIQPTGLITSNSGPLDSIGGRSGHPEPSASFNKKVHYSGAVTRLVKNAQPRAPLGFLNKFPDAELRRAIDGEFVKITGVVTCGSIPLETSFRRTSRCVYVSTELYEYRGWGGKPANSTHRFFSWGRRHSEKFVADFYISDFQSGLRALVKAGYGAKVTPFVKPSKVIDVTQSNRELSPNFLQWLADRNLSSDDRIMRLKEGYIKEGSTVSVMGVVRRQANVLMIVPPSDPISTGCQWGLCLPPSNIDALILACDESQNSDVIPV